MLIVPVPPENTARLRFVTTKDSLFSKMIRFDTSGAVSHVEAVMADGTIISSAIHEGVRRHPNDYDDRSTLQIFVDVPMPPEMYVAWSDFLESRIGWPYDNLAIVEFITKLNAHTVDAIICSALQVDALRHCGYFPRKLAQRYHDIAPVVLLLQLQAQPIERCIVHPVEGA